jgi:hypothetical protein
METTSNISTWLHSFQLTYGTRTVGAIDELIRRTKGIDKKINSLLNTLYALEEKCGVNLTSYRERMHDMIAIRDAIRVYGIYHPTHGRREKEPNMLWHTYDPFVLSDYKEGNEWLDYFGQDDGITEVGGYVVVSLSHSGILYLNGIAEKVSYWSSSPDKRYYTTVTI